MSIIDIPAQKEILWHKMREDLRTLVPWFDNHDLLFCPTCLRPLPYNDFSVEHILPQRALKVDAKSVREVISKNERSGLTLLCSRNLIYKGKTISGTGCNGWKGKHIDRFLQDVVAADFSSRDTVYSQHQVALVSAGYLALFRTYGYQVALSEAGLIMRMQFFNTKNFIPIIPSQTQMMLIGEGLGEYSEDHHAYWSEPFKITIDPPFASVVMRHASIRLPISHDPTKPFARVLEYVPSKYRFRVDVRTAFK